MILRSREFTGVDPNNFQKGAESVGVRDGSPPVGSKEKVPVGVWGTKSPEAEAKCDIGVQF